jgi:hypothetical protein
MHKPTEAQEQAAWEEFHRVAERIVARMLVALRSARLNRKNGWEGRAPDYLGLYPLIGRRLAEEAEATDTDIDFDYLMFGILRHLDKKRDPPPPPDLAPKDYQAALNRQQQRHKAIKTLLRLTTIDGKPVEDER